MTARNDLRRRHYISRPMQGALIVSLLVLEVLVVAVSFAFVYRELSAAVDVGLFRIHAPPPDGASVLWRALRPVLPWMILFNIGVLAAVVVLWSARVSSIAGWLHLLAERAQRLEWRRPGPAPQGHEVIAAAERWFEQERAHWLEVRAGLDQVLGTEDAGVPRTDGALVAELRALQDRLSAAS